MITCDLSLGQEVQQDPEKATVTSNIRAAVRIYFALCMFNASEDGRSDCSSDCRLFRLRPVIFKQAWDKGLVLLESTTIHPTCHEFKSI